MVEEGELFGVRIQINLPGQIRNIEPADVVLHECQRHDQRHLPRPVFFDEAGLFQAHGIAGRAQPKFDFGADGHPFKVLSESIGEIAVVFVAAVVTDLLSQKACGNPYTDRIVRPFIVDAGVWDCHCLAP
jgi:hypothetical protein